jgi:hypothetical protein
LLFRARARARSLSQKLRWEDWKDAPTQIPEELLPRKCPEPTIDWERDPITGNPVVWEEYKKEYLDPLPDPEVLDRDPTEEEIEDMVELIYHRMYMRGVRFFPVDGTTRHVKKSKKKTKKTTWGNELNGQLPLMGPNGPGSKKVGEQWPPKWEDADIPITLRDNVTEKFWAGNAAQKDTTGPEYGFMKDGVAHHGTVAGKEEDYYDTSVEDAEREKMRLRDIERGVASIEAGDDDEDIDEDKE